MKEGQTFYKEERREQVDTPKAHGKGVLTA
jgi:hypothetical protein